MSSMLEQAIIDAKSLKDAATRNAEHLIIEKYSTEIKNQMEKLLEQEAGGLGAALGAPVGGAAGGLGGDLGGGLGGGMDLGLGATPAAGQPPIDFEAAGADKDDLPNKIEYAALDGATIGYTEYPEEGELITINLDALNDYEMDPARGPTARNLAESLEIEEDLLEELLGEELLELDDELLAEAAIEEDKILAKEGDDALSDDDLKNLKIKNIAKVVVQKDDDDFSDDDAVDTRHVSDDDDVEVELEEGIKVDYKFTKYANDAFGTTDEQGSIDLMLAKLVEEAEELELQNESLVKKNNLLIQKNKKLNVSLKENKKTFNDFKKQYNTLIEGFTGLKEKFEESQLMNVKMLYTNKILADRSLNRRQKDKIVESLDKTESVEQAKIVYDTLKSTVEVTHSRGPKSLGEAVSRRSSQLLVRSAKAKEPEKDGFAERMKRLAGIDIIN